MEKKWFVFYTKSRQEKKVRDLLLKNGFEAYLPLHKVVRQWSDRKKKVEVPLFNSYIFVNEREHNLIAVLSTPGIAWNIRSNGKPATLKIHELELIQRFIETGYTLECIDIDVQQFKSGDRARILEGPLAGMVGVISGGLANQRFNFLIESIDRVISVQVPPALLQKEQ